ncbi:helix-turn-helix domain-containing protein [Candidatus Contendibacter odensensis]|nr:helix-turn-helix domain-containing protein [Candidatus Contendobacter odensis]MBK8752284.1 helix-turn-helix domain-containing protein [Candidatus Competibacteraceae bacterium]
MQESEPLRLYTHTRRAYAHRKALSRAAEVQINALLEAERIERRAVYRPGEVCRLLRISPTTLRQLCELAEQPESSCRPPQSLESFRIGCHRRIEHTTLVNWLARNQSMEREG